MINKEKFLKEINDFNEIQADYIKDYAYDHYNGGVELTKDNIEKIVLNTILNSSEFKDTRVTKSTTFAEWISEINDIANSLDILVVYNYDFEIDKCIKLFNEFYSEAEDRYYEEESSSYYEEDESYWDDEEEE